jgi:replication factor C large subunit
MWTEKYRPKTIAEVIGNEEAKAKFLRWLKKWKPGDKATLLYGPPGVGKTTLVQVTAREFNYDLVEMNASDTRTEEKVMRVAGSATNQASLQTFFAVSRGSMLLLDEVDGIYGREDQGGVGAISQIIKEAKTPIILVANDPSDLKLRPLRELCSMIRFYEIRPPVLMALLQKICKEEGVTYEKEALKIIIAKSQGDVRSAINDLQSFAERNKQLKATDIKDLAVRDKQYDIFDTLRGIFLAEPPETARRALNESQVDYETLFETLHDNLPRQYTDPEELASAYNSLSIADVYFGRIKRTQDWGLLSYALEQMTVGIASARRREYTPIAYQFPPSNIILLSRTREERELKKNINSRIAAKCHVSRKVANTDFLPFLKIIFKNDPSLAAKLEVWLQLDEEEASYLAGEEAKPKKKTEKLARKKRSTKTSK